MNKFLLSGAASVTLQLLTLAMSLSASVLGGALLGTSSMAEVQVAIRLLGKGEEALENVYFILTGEKVPRHLRYRKHGIHNKAPGACLPSKDSGTLRVCLGTRIHGLEARADPGT
jgi:hypothetical protein